MGPCPSQVRNPSLTISRPSGKPLEPVCKHSSDGIPHNSTTLTPSFAPQTLTHDIAGTSHCLPAAWSRCHRRQSVLSGSLFAQHPTVSPYKCRACFREDLCRHDDWPASFGLGRVPSAWSRCSSKNGSAVVFKSGKSLDSCRIEEWRPSIVVAWNDPQKPLCSARNRFPCSLLHMCIYSTPTLL